MTLEQRIEWADEAVTNWDPVQGGRRAWVYWDDSIEADLGPDPSGERFRRIRDAAIRGDYYPPDAVRFFGRFRTENRALRVGDRVLQRARVLPLLHWPIVWSVAEIVVIEDEPSRIKIGYVTTNRQHARGAWSAELRLREGVLSIQVQSTASPRSALFWLGLPLARWLQLRARRRALEEFAK